MIPLASISERDWRKGGSGYGRVGFVEAGSHERRRARKCVFLPVEVILCIEKISIERRELKVVGM